MALRRERGSGPRGLAGMSAIREIEGLRLLRPLLGVPKAQLLATLLERGAKGIDDPSNRDARFARTRLRSRSIPAAIEAASHGPARAAEDLRLGEIMAARARPHPLGFVRFDLSGLDRLPALVVERLLLTVSGGTLPPRRERLSRLVDRLSTGDSHGDARRMHPAPSCRRAAGDA